MLRGWLGLASVIAVGLALFAGAVLLSVHHASRPAGFSGLEFAPLTAAAAARTPLLRNGVLVSDVMDDSPAARAGIRAGMVVTAIDGRPAASARAAAERIKAGRAGARLTLTLYDLTEGKPKPQRVSLVFDAAPPAGSKLSVHPPRTLARESFAPPVAAANAAWSRRIYRGATIKPLALSGLGSGQCNAFAPERWQVAGHAADNSMFHIMARESFQHAIFQSAALNGADAEDYVRGYIEKTFGGAKVTLTPAQARPYGFVLHDFGNARGGAGFVLYRVTDGRIALWLAAVAGGEAGWAKPLAGAAALSIRCAAPGAPAPQPRDKDLLAARISLRCIHGQCEETDFAATYLTTLRLGYVHNTRGDVFLVKPSRDYWINGAEGPGFYHQIGGENERLYPGRIN